MTSKGLKFKSLLIALAECFVHQKQISIVSYWNTKYNTSSCLDCIDAVEHSQSCPIWAIYGYCYSDSNWYNFMSSNCEKSCGKCKSGKKRVINPILPRGSFTNYVTQMGWVGGQQKHYYCKIWKATLWTEINVPRTFINFQTFSHPYDPYFGPYV